MPTLQKLRAETAIERGLVCSFCNQEPIEGSDLIAGPDDVFICDDCLARCNDIAGELGELLEGKVEARRSPKEVTIFKSLGLAVEDVFAADLAYRRAIAQEVGRELEL
jgi:hypothetical protein